MFEKNQILFVKISGEPVFALEVLEDGETIRTRRYVKGQEGTRYIQEHFSAAELETEEDARKRLKRAMQMDPFGGLFAAGSIDEPPEVPPAGDLSSN